MPDPGVIFDEQTAKRLMAMLKEWESTLSGVTQPQNGPPPPGGFKLRQGKLDSVLSVGGTATVSIWWNSSTHSYVKAVNADTGDDWEDCCGPITQSSEIAGGTAVIVAQVGVERLIIGAACPE